MESPRCRAIDPHPWLGLATFWIVILIVFVPTVSMHGIIVDVVTRKMVSGDMWVRFKCKDKDE